MRKESWAFEERVWRAGDKETLILKEAKSLHSSSQIQEDYFKNVASSQYLSKEGLQTCKYLSGTYSQQKALNRP